VGDIFVVGAISGKVRAMIDDKGKQVKEAGPSVPVEVLGLSGVPSAGDTLTVVENEARAREVAAYRQGLLDTKRTTSAPLDLENIFASEASTTVEYPLVVKADVQGSAEAIVNALNRISNEDIKVRVLHFGAWAGSPSPTSSWRARKRRADHRLQRPAQRQGARDRRAQQGRVPLLRRHLPPHRLGEVGDGGRARAGDDRDGARPCARPGSLPRRQAGQGGRSARARGVIRKGLHARLTREDVIVSKTSISSLRRFKDDVAECARASSAACCWLTPTTSRRAITSKSFEVEERARTL
jgi:translation initiation factor IF-2